MPAKTWSLLKKIPKKRPKKVGLTAASANKHVLYEASVQNTHADIEFMDKVYRQRHKAIARDLREDFCGTAKLCADWVASDPQRTAVGLDLHQPTLRWGMKQHVEKLETRSRAVNLLCRNVLEGPDKPVDVTVAFNFSYCIFKKRQQMLQYLTGVHSNLRRTGALFLDIHGGTETFEELEESTKHRGFKYIWQQEPFDAINGFAKRYIHFGFDDGTMLKRAFSYDWRLWTLPELQDILYEAGFAQVDVYWEGATSTGRGNGQFKRVRRADNEACWVAYVVAWKSPAGKTP